MNIESSAFKHDEAIPKKYTCDGSNINPPLTIKNIPSNAKSIVLIVDDPDAPIGTWLHWLVWNIDIKGYIDENSVPGIEGMNDFKRNSYGGPCPPSGVHRYFFRVYALDTMLQNKPGSSKGEIEDAMKSHVIAKAELVGLYSRFK